MTTQLTFADDVYTAGMDPTTAAILDLISGDPLHERDREAIVDAIRASVRPDGTTDANAWRPLVPKWCYPRCVGATVYALARTGILEATGEWIVSDDLEGRNSGKPQRVYRFRGTP